MTRFTIITVCYNAAAILPRTLDSVRIQQWPHVQHIIIDGASTDDTMQCVAHYQRRCAQQQSPHTITVVSEPDKGIYDAMNKALPLVEGDYVVYLNAGDALPHPDTLYNIGTRARNTNADALPGVIYGDTDLIDAAGLVVGHRHLSAPQHLDSRSFRMGMLVCHQAFYARADLARHTPYDLRYRFSADVDWCIRILKAAEAQHATTLNMHCVLVHYLREGTTTRNHRASLRERFSVMRRHYGLSTTLLQHAAFCVRALKRKIGLDRKNKTIQK